MTAIWALRAASSFLKSDLSVNKLTSMHMFQWFRLQPNQYPSSCGIARYNLSRSPAVQGDHALFEPGNQIFIGPLEVPWTNCWSGA